MPAMPPTFRPPFAPTRREQNRAADARRGSAQSRGYDSRWAKASAGHRRDHPLCEYCRLVDQVKACELVDHLYPHRGDQALFWNTTYWVSCCNDCHNTFKQRLERRGKPALDALALRLGLQPLPG